MNKLIYIFSYFTFLAAPRALLIKYVKRDVEISDLPLWAICLLELVFRLGIFVLFSASLESILTDQIFEKYNGDQFLIILFISGLLHTLLYYFCFIYKSKTNGQAFKFYRLFRNLFYSVLPAFFLSTLIVFYSDYIQDPISENTETYLFLSVWFTTIFIAILESLIAKNYPRGMGDKFSTALDSYQALN